MTANSFSYTHYLMTAAAAAASKAQLLLLLMPRLLMQVMIQQQQQQQQQQDKKQQRDSSSRSSAQNLGPSFDRTGSRSAKCGSTIRSGSTTRSSQDAAAAAALGPAPPISFRQQEAQGPAAALLPGGVPGQ
jgi:hypothetical protein